MRTIAGLLLTTLLTMSAGCASTDWIDRTLVTVDVTGTWYGYSAGSAGREIFLELKQEGSRVTGVMRSVYVGNIASGPIDGTVAGDVFRFKRPNGSAEGELTVSGDEMSGRVTLYAQSSGAMISLRRVDAFPRPGPPTR